MITERTRDRLLFAPAAIVTLLGTVTLGCSASSDQNTQPAPLLASVVGNWATVEDGGPAFKIDGEAWSGQTDAAHLQASVQTLFGEANQSFVANGTAAGAFPLAVFNEVYEFSQGTLKVQFKLVGGKSDQTAGIVLGLQPNGEYLFVRYNTKDGNVAVWRYANGQRSVIAHGDTHKQLALGTWHELTVTVSGTKVTGSVDGDSVTVEHTLDAPVSGRVGLWAKRDAITVFRNFRVATSA